MDFFKLIGILSIAVYSVECVGFRGLTYQGMKEPEPSEWKKINFIKERWITQRVDHFHIQDNRTWQMRFMENDEYFDGSGPIFIMLGGEWKISQGFLQSGLMHGIGVEHKALMYYTEHRYYGQSKLFENLSTENLKYLNVDQALADVTYFIEAMKQERNLKNTMVIVFGGSYSANMAVWLRQKYPHMVQGALASSGPVYAKANFHEYLKVVAASLGKYSKRCVTETRKAFNQVEKMVKTELGLKIIKKEFNLCGTPNPANISSIGTFAVYLTETFSGAVQYNRIIDGKSTIGEICDKMTNKGLGAPIQRLAKVVNDQETCFETDYAVFLDAIGNTSSDEDSGMMRQWMFQTCTEYGYYQTTEYKKSIFGSLLKFEYFMQLCKDLYGNEFGANLLNEGVMRTNIVYGGKNPAVTNVIFVNGNLDPWHSLSVLEDLNESSPAILIDGSSHCMDLQNDDPTDVEDLTKARIRSRKIIGQWVESWQEEISKNIQ